VILGGHASIEREPQTAPARSRDRAASAGWPGSPATL
jgi:hypothetical protein